MKKAKRRLSVGEVAKKIGVHRTTIYRWLRAKHAPKPVNTELFDKLMIAMIKDARFKEEN